MIYADNFNFCLLDYEAMQAAVHVVLRALLCLFQKTKSRPIHLVIPVSNPIIHLCLCSAAPYSRYVRAMHPVCQEDVSVCYLYEWPHYLFGMHQMPTSTPASRKQNLKQTV